MEINKKIIASLLSMGLLAGCGSDSGSDSVESNSYGVQYEGKSADLILTADHKESLVDYANTSLFVMINSLDIEQQGNTFNDLVTELSEMIKGEIGTATIDTTIPGDCGPNSGSAKFTGNYQDFLIRANAYCEQYSSGYFTVTGGIDFSISNGLNNIYFDHLKMESNQLDSSIAINGEIKSGVNLLSIYGDVSVDGKTTPVSLTINVNESATMYYMVFKSRNGEILKVEELSLVDSNSLNRVFTGNLYLPELGKTKLTLADVDFCEDGSIGDGTVGFEDEEGNRISIVYSECGSDPESYFSMASER